MIFKMVFYREISSIKTGRCLCDRRGGDGLYSMKLDDISRYLMIFERYSYDLDDILSISTIFGCYLDDIYHDYRSIGSLGLDILAYTPTLWPQGGADVCSIIPDISTVQPRGGDDILSF